MFKQSLKNRRAKAAIIAAVLACLLVGTVAQANGRYATQDMPINSMRHQGNSNLDSVLLPMMHSQNQRSDYRSRSEVMDEVKRRYDARVLRISLNKQREVYNVRLLMPNGKVRNIQVSARR